MSDKNIAVFGIYSTRIDVERASDALNTAGFPAADISVLMPSSLNGAVDMGIEANTKALKAGWNYGETTDAFISNYQSDPAHLAPGK